MQEKDANTLSVLNLSKAENMGLKKLQLPLKKEVKMLKATSSKAEDENGPPKVKLVQMSE